MQATVINKRLAGKKILVAEDVEMNQLLIRQILETSGATVVIAPNGLVAVEEIKKQPFDCILMDVQMPEMDGIEATVQIRAMPDPVLSSVPIIALTANCTPDDLVKYQAAGMNDYLSKPVAEANLLDTILNYANRQRRAEGVTEVGEADKLYDLTMIQSVSGGDAAFIKKMVNLFIETVPPNVKDLVDSTSAGDWDRVSKMAHKLKSTIDSMGIRSLHEQIRAVETQARGQVQPESIPALVHEIQTVVSSCIEQLEEEFA